MTGILAACAGPGVNQLSVSCSPTAVAGTYDTEFGTGITDATTAAPTGGLAPYTYSWAKLSGSDFTFIPSSIAATVAFSFGGTSHQVGVYRVTVSDASGQSAHADVTVTAN